MTKEKVEEQNQPNVIFCGKSKNLAFESYSDGMGPNYDLPSIEEQFEEREILVNKGKADERKEIKTFPVPFYHAESGRLVRLYSSLYKFFVEKGK